MHQIYFTAFATTLLAVLLIGGLIKWKSGKENFNLVLVLFLIELPMAFIAYYLVRMPLVDALFKMIFQGNNEVYGFMRLLYAPLTEEPAKLLPLLIPSIRNKITKENFVWCAMALGLGFGIGEIWLVANFIAQSGQYSDLAWYMFSGFINERFMVCIIHAGMTSVALRRLHNKFILGLLGAMTLHFLCNFPIYLSGIGFAGIPKSSWQVILSIYVIVFLFAMVGLMAYFKYGKLELGRLIYGISVCPECNFEYPAPLFGVNWINRRYERCPNCHKWHWTKTIRKD